MEPIVHVFWYLMNLIHNIPTIRFDCRGGQGHTVGVRCHHPSIKFITKNSSLTGPPCLLERVGKHMDTGDILETLEDLIGWNTISECKFLKSRNLTFP